MKLPLFILLFAQLGLCATTTAQDTRKERVKTASGAEANLTSTTTGMYGGTKSPKAQEHFDDAREAHEKRDLERAEKSYLKALKEDPGFIEAYDNLGQVYRQQEEYDKAIKNYKKSIALYPEGTMARQNLAVVYGLLNNYPEATKQYEALVKYHPEDPEGYFGLGNCNMITGDLDDALLNAQKALDIYESTASEQVTDGYQLVGMIHHLRKEPTEARASLQKAKDLGAEIHPKLEQEVFGSSAAKEDDEIRMETPEDYAKLEPQVLQAFDWLLNTPVGNEPEKRRQLSAFLITWAAGSPSVTIEIKEGLVPYMDQSESLVIFMGGYCVYSTQHKGSVRSEDAALYATERVIEFYQANVKALGKNKEIDKLVKLKEQGELKTYIKKHS